MQTVKTKSKNSHRPRRRRIIGWSIFIFIALAIAGGIWYWNTHKKEIIKNKIETAIREKSNGLYKIEYDSLAMDELAGYLSISNMKLSWDSTRYLDNKKQGQEPAFLLSIDIPEISVSGVKTPKALIGNEIVGRKLEIKNPVITILYTNSTDTTRAVAQQEIYEQILGNLDLIQADTIEVTGAQITTRHRQTKKTGIELKDVFITLVNVKIDSASNADTSRLFFSKETSIRAGKLSWTSANKLYTYKAADISLNSVSRLLRIKSFHMVPALNEEAFVKALPTQDDRFDFSISNMEIQNISLPLLSEEKIVADQLQIAGVSLKIYRDLAIPRDTKNRVGSYPQQVIQNIPFLCHIKKVVVSNGFIEYKERSHITRESGKVQFYKITATATNFTNDKKAIASNNRMEVNMGSSFLNKTPLKANWLFYLLHPKGRFELVGSVGPIDGSALNPLTEPMGPASIKKGKIHGVEFNMQGDDYGMDGTVKMLYDDLKVAMLEKDKGATGTDKKTLTSLLANIIIKNSNPKPGEPPRIAQVHLDRDINRSIFYLSWKTIFKGAKETAGLPR